MSKPQPTQYDPDKDVSRVPIRPRLSGSPSAPPVPPPPPVAHQSFPQARRPQPRYIPELNEDGSNRWDVAIALLNVLADGGDHMAQKALSVWFRMVAVRNQ